MMVDLDVKDLHEYQVVDEDIEPGAYRPQPRDEIVIYDKRWWVVSVQQILHSGRGLVRHQGDPAGWLIHARRIPSGPTGSVESGPRAQSESISIHPHEWANVRLDKLAPDSPYRRVIKIHDDLRTAVKSLRDRLDDFEQCTCLRTPNDLCHIHGPF